MRIGEGRRFLEVVSRLCGPEIAAAMQKERAGRKIKVPYHASKLTWLRKFVGPDAIKVLTEEFQGAEFIMPMGERHRLTKLRNEIQALSSIGWSTFRIGAELGVHPRTVQRHLTYLKARRKTPTS